MVGAAREQRRGEGEVAVAGRDEPAATSFELRRPAPLPVGAVFDDRLTGDGIVALVRRRQPADALAAHAEGGVLHSERIADPLAQGIPERHASGPGDEHAGHVGGGVVHPALTWLVDERKPAEPAESIVRGRVAECVQRVADPAPSPLGWDDARARGIRYEMP